MNIFKRPKIEKAAEPYREARDVMYGERTTFERDGKKFHVISGVYEEFWDRVKSDRWEAETFLVLRQNVTDATLYVDIGAWIGPTVLYGGSLAKRVVAVEPDPFAMAALIANLDLNDEIRNKTELFSTPISTISGPLQMHAEVFGNSETSVLASRGDLRLTCMSIGCAEFLQRVIGEEDHIFIKVDVEGAEYNFLPELVAFVQAHKLNADFYVSLHGLFRQGTEENMQDWARNLKDHGSVLSCLADYGTLHLFDGSAWQPLRTPFGGNFVDLAARGGVQTEILVKRAIA